MWQLCGCNTQSAHLSAVRDLRMVQAGLFNGASGGTMLARTVFAVVNKGEADSMTISWSVTIS